MIAAQLERYAARRISMRIIGMIFALFLFLSPVVVLAECSDAVSNGDDTYSYARKAYNETSFDDAQDYARKAKNAADDAKSAAEDCNCDEAASNFDDAYTYARRAYNADNLSELRDYARKAMRAADAGKDAAENCR
jgi:hypothetical protein